MRMLEGRFRLEALSSTKARMRWILVLTVIATGLRAE